VNVTLIRKVAWAAGAVVLTAGAGMGYLLATFDPNAYKQLLVDRVQQDYQRTLVIQGPIELGFWPRLQVQLSDVSLSEHQQAGAEFARLGQLRMAVQVMPLLKGQLHVGKLQASGVKLNYRRDAQGRSNIDDLLKPSATPATDDASQALSFDVAGISLQNTQVVVDDATTGVQATLDLQSFESGRLANGQATDVHLTAQTQWRQPYAAQVAMEGSVNLTPDLDKRQYTARQVNLQIKVLTRQPSGSEALNLSTDIQANSLAWDGHQHAAQAEGLLLTAAGVLNPVGKGEQVLKIDQAQLKLDQFIYDPQAQRLTLSKLDAAVDMQQGGLARQFRALWPSLTVNADQLQGSALSGSFKVAGPVSLEGQFKSQAPSGSFQAIHLPGLTLDLAANMPGQRTISAKVQTQLHAQLKQQTATLDALQVQARISEPALQPLQLTARGRVMASGQADNKGSSQGAQWQLQGDINSNPFTTQGQMRLGQGVPHVDATAQFAVLDLNRLLPPSSASSATQAASQPAGAADRTPVDLGALRDFNGRIEIKAGQLAWQHYRVTDANILAQIQQGQLSLQNLSGAAWGGRFKAQGSASGHGAQGMALQAQADGVNVLALLKDVMGKEVLEGTGQIKLDVRTAGATVGQLTAGLNGSAGVVLRDGAVRGINLARSLREAKAKLKGQQDAVQQAKQTEKTDFTEMLASFAITDGVAVNQDLTAKSPFLRVTGAGEIDLKQRRLDYTIKTTVTGTQKGQDGDELEALKGLTVPVRLSGPFTALGWQVAWSSVAVGSVQNTIKGQIDGKLDDAKGKLTDRLKDKLLGKPEAAASGASAASAPALSAEEAAKQKLKNKFKGLFN
jgi:AsmA protein